MPDWSYDTVFRPVLFRVEPLRARNFALGFLGALARFPGGRTVIRLMGHMQPPAELEQPFGPHMLPSPVGLGAELDSRLVATEALSHFGFGFMEVGPFTEGPLMPASQVVVDRRREAVIVSPPFENPGMESALRRMREDPQMPMLVRLAPALAETSPSLADIENQLHRFAPVAAGFTIAWESLGKDRESLGCLSRALRDYPGSQLVVRVSADADPEEERALVQAVASKEIDGVLIDGAMRAGSPARHLEKACFEAVRRRIVDWRRVIGAEPVLIACGGIHEPWQGIDALQAGANLIVVDSGMVFSGPGLPKRINDAVFFLRQSHEDITKLPAPQCSWFWQLLMGLSMFAGGVMALVIALTRVIMPYDEAAIGLSREQIQQLNEMLIPFMAHDRTTLAGTMIALGLLYWLLAWFGARRGLHWAQLSVSSSAFVGFMGFFLFLGFGYFDPFHAFVTAILFQFLLLALHSQLPRRSERVAPGLTNNAAWRLSQWGQLFCILHGAALIVAGAVISTVGITTVFVPEDLEFMRTTAEELHAYHPHLVPLVAHDRATFGAMLLATGVTVLLASLWGFRRGYAWLWWGLLLAGSVAYLATIHIHWHVGYTSFKHLIPAYAGLAALWISSALSRSYLCATDAETDAHWRRLGHSYDSKTR